MPVIDLKPHSLSFLKTSVGFEDDNGDWHEINPESSFLLENESDYIELERNIGGDSFLTLENDNRWSEPVKCHAVASGSANKITYDDGTVDYYSYTIGRLPKDFKSLEVGEKVKLCADGSEKIFTVKGFHRYQLQCKVWV